jgi:hypothetical protein
MSAVIRDLYLVRDKDLDQLESKAREALTAWARDWLPGAPKWAPVLEALATNSSALQAPQCMGWHGFARGMAQHATMWAAQSEATLARLAAQLVGRQSTAPMADADWALQAAATAVDDLHARLLGQPLPADTALPELQALSGAVLLHETSLGLNWIWAASAHAGHKSTGLATAANISTVHLQPISSGLASQAVLLTVGLGEVEIPMADLVALQTGDVIRFPALLKGSVPVAFGPGGAEIPTAQAQLGQRDGHVAVKLVSKQTVA